MTKLFQRPRQKRSEQDVGWLLSLMSAYNSVDYARQFAHALAGAALHEFDLIYGNLPPSRDKAFLHGLATWIFLR